MRERFDEPLPLSALASAALLSQFHFSRTFRRETGVSPGRYLAAVRLYEAKRLLLTTSATVADISCRVGYSSVGTFTTRFTRSVGMPPNRYRQIAQSSVLAVDQDFRHIPDVARPSAGAQSSTTGTIAGRFELPPGTVLNRTLVGVFTGPIPQSHPVACSLVYGTPERWRVEGVPAGSWVVLTMATQPADPVIEGMPPMLVSSSGTVTVKPGGTTEVTALMRALLPTDPPILLTVHHPLATA